MKAIIYHNPNCSKSRSTVALLEKQGIKFQIIEYLVNPPSSNELKSLARKLGLDIQNLVRTGEPEFKDANIDLATATEEQILQLLNTYPILIQRPIVEIAEGARIGRPPNTILELFE